jgi:hypothetical protein
MKIVHRDELKSVSCPDGSLGCLEGCLGEVVLSGELEEYKYGCYAGPEIIEDELCSRDHNPIFPRLEEHCQMIERALGYNIKGKRILDLGCGCSSDNYESGNFPNNMYGPWMGRFMHFMKDGTGIEYIGVDCGSNTEEKFDYRRLDLLEPDALSREFKEDYFDLVLAFMLFSSPELAARSGQKKEYYEYNWNADAKSAKGLADIIMPQIERIAKPDGVFLWHGGDIDFG